MRPLALLIVIILGIVGIWLTFWNFIDFLTTGLNTGVWNWAILQVAFPSIAIGVTLIIICAGLGVFVLRG